MPGDFTIPSRFLVAIGGNATHPEDIEGTSQEQKTIADHNIQQNQTYSRRLQGLPQCGTTP